MQMAHKSNGFTLIELMIVVVIIAILAAIAYPAYTGSVQKARRADGTATLADTAQRLERCYTMYSAYNNAACVPAPADFPLTSPEGFYEIQATVLIEDTFTLTAVPQGAQSSDTNCANLTLTSLGVRNSTGTWQWDRCW